MSTGFNWRPLAPRVYHSGDRYLTFVAVAGERHREWRVRTYGTPSEEQLQEIREAVGLWAYPDERCVVNLSDQPYIEGITDEPVHGFLDARPIPKEDRR